MNATTVGVDLAKSHFELVVSDAGSRVQRRERMTRTQFSRFFANFPPSRIVMEAYLQRSAEEIFIAHAPAVPPGVFRCASGARLQLDRRPTAASA